jgi:hypothetical protein
MKLEFTPDFRISEKDLRELLLYKAIVAALATEDFSETEYFEKAIIKFLNLHNVNDLDEFIDLQINAMKNKEN